MIKIGIFVDFMGTIGMTPEDEMDYIETMFKEYFPNDDLVFERDVSPHTLANSTIDIYVFDFGGLMPGCDSLISSNYRELLNQVEDRPNTLFILWGALARNYYEDEFIDKFEDEDKLPFPNVLFKYGGDTEEADNLFEKIKDWIDLSVTKHL